MKAGKTVLVVDKDEDVVRGMVARLGAAGFQTVTQDDCAKGLETAREVRPDAIVMDLLSGSCGGYSALEQLHDAEETRDIPIVMLSTRIHEKQKVLDAGAHFFLPKPYRGTSLVDAVTVAIKDAQKTDEPIKSKATLTFPTEAMRQ